MAFNDLMKAVVHMSVYGVQCENAFWYRQTAEGQTANSFEAYLATAVRGYYVANLVPLLSEDASVDNVEIWNYTDGIGYYNSGSAPTVGTVAQPAAPSQWCVGAKMNRPGVGWNYPRKRVSGFPLSVYIDNGVEPGFANEVLIWANLMRGLSNSGNNFQWCVIRPSSTFTLGNVGSTVIEPVGTCNAIYDASQNTRRN